MARPAVPGFLCGMRKAAACGLRTPFLGSQRCLLQSLARHHAVSRGSLTLAQAGRYADAVQFIWIARFPGTGASSAQCVPAADRMCLVDQFALDL